VDSPTEEELSRLRERSRPAESGGVNVVTVGRLIPERRHGQLLVAFAGLHGQFPGSRLTIVGDGPELGPLRAQAVRLGTGGAVHFVGRVPTDAVRGYLCGADVYVSASSADMAGNAVMEAAACGLPIVTTRVGFPAVLVRDGRNGYTVEVGDERGLSEAMRRLMGEPGLRAAAGGESRRRVRELRLSWADSARQFMRIYASLSRAGGHERP
jgi:glycosyltransferase involved in cell wall biosynthesis